MTDGHESAPRRILLEANILRPELTATVAQVVTPNAPVAANA